MTNLFYPSLALYEQKRAPPTDTPSPLAYNHHQIPLHEQVGSFSNSPKDRPFSVFGTPVLDTFFPYPPPLLPRLKWAGWWGIDTGQDSEGGWTSIRAPLSGEGPIVDPEEEIWLMRVGWADVGDVLDRHDDIGEKVWRENDDHLFNLFKDMAESWDSLSPTSGQGCLRQLQSEGEDVGMFGPCYILAAKPGPSHVDAISLPTVEPASGDSDGIARVATSASDNSSIYHSFALPFRVPRNRTADFNEQWLESVTSITQEVGGEVFVEAQSLRDHTGEWFISVRKFLLRDNTTLNAS